MHEKQGSKSAVTQEAIFVPSLTLATILVKPDQARLNNQQFEGSRGNTLCHEEISMSSVMRFDPKMPGASSLHSHTVGYSQFMLIQVYY